MIEDGESTSGSGLLKDYQDPGTPPGTLRSADGESGPARIVLTSYTAADIEVREIADPEALDRLRGDGRVHWIHVVGLADVAIVEHMGTAFGLHPLALEDVLTLGQRPKAEEFDDTLFCIVQHLTYRRKNLERVQLSLFLGKDFVVTFQPRADDLLALIRERLVKGRTKLRQKGAGYLSYAVLDLIVDSAFPALEALGDQLDAIEEGILEKPDQEDIEQLQCARRELLVLRQVLWPQREVMGRLSREEHELMPDDVRLYFRDCYDHAVQALEVSENFREMASGLLDIYLTSLSHRLNDVMKVLTIISTVFMPLSFFAGVYGMNFNTDQPFNMPELGWKYGYLGFWGVTIAGVVTMLWLFRRKGWL
jgi:magnesium transporter